MLNTSPYNQATEAVRLMTVFKAKGLEFAHVFLVSSDDSAWGSRATGMGNKLTLPANLAAIRHAGSTDDERLRLLYVAMTRAKNGLYLTSHTHTFSGKQTAPVKYFNEVAGEDGSYITGILPAGFASVVTDDAQPPSLDALTMNWQTRHLDLEAPLTELLSERLKRYRLSPTHLTHFIDLKYGGPQSFLLGTILRFPSAPTIEICFGNAVHDALEWAQNELNKTGILPDHSKVLDRAEKFLATQEFTPEQRASENKHAAAVLKHYLARSTKTFVQGNLAERSFRDEGVFVSDVHMGGKIDLLEIDKAAKKITVVDYKTGQLGTDPAKLHRYTLQLYCYKILVEGSHSFAGYKVEQGRLVFVEPDAGGKITEKTIVFDAKELERTRQLLASMWQRVMALDMPDISAYGDTLKDIRNFEDSLIDTKK